MDHADLIATREAVMDMVLTGLNDRDLGNAWHVFTDDVVVDVVPVALELTGLAEFRGFMEVYFDTFPDMHLRKDNCVVTAAFGFLECEFTGTMCQDILGVRMPESGRPFIAKRAVAVAEFTPDARIRRWSEYWDLATVLRATGALPANP